MKHFLLFYAVSRLSGLSPFAGADDYETLEKVRKGRWDFDSSAFSGISDVGKDFIRKLIQTTPQ